eukprot:scaffold46104_cov16-Tisochrysis_lutea.AAC.1
MHADACVANMFLTEKRAGDEEKMALVNKAKCFIFDCDGGWSVHSSTQGKRLFFITNNSTKSRAGYLKKFQSLGLPVQAEEIYSSSYAAAAYLESINFQKKVGIMTLVLQHHQHCHKNSRATAVASTLAGICGEAYVVGEEGIQEELDLKGIKHLGGPADGSKSVNLKSGEYMHHDPEVSGGIARAPPEMWARNVMASWQRAGVEPACLSGVCATTQAVLEMADAWSSNATALG